MVLAMKLVIPYKVLKFTLVFTLLLVIGCNSEDSKPTSANSQKLESINYRTIKKAELTTPFGQVLDITLAITEEDQVRGLSGVKPENFKDQEGMLFFYTKDQLHHFWMPNTFFDLDLFYLDHNFRVIGLKRRLVHFKEKGPSHLVPRAEPFYSRHVLEMKSDSSIAAKIGMGMTLKWISQPTPQQIESSIRREQ